MSPKPVPALPAFPALPAASPQPVLALPAFPALPAASPQPALALPAFPVGVTRAMASQTAARGAAPSSSQRLEGIPPPLVPDLCPPMLECPQVLGAWEGSLAPSYVRLSLPEGDSAARPGAQALARSRAVWRMQLAGGIGASALYGALYTWAYFAWYRGRPKNEHIVIRWEGAFGANTYGGGSDKLGHYVTAYMIARATTGILTRLAWSPMLATVLGSTLSLAWFTAIELKDGMHKGFGFSPEDMIANTLGVLTSALMVLWPGFDDLFDFRIYYRPSKPFTKELIEKRNVDLAEDYTGITYLLALRLMGIPWIRNTRWARPLRFVDLLVGYNARGFLPRPTNDRWREREIFFGFGLNLMAILEDVAPGSRIYHVIDNMQEFFHLTPVARIVRVRAFNAQPKDRSH